MSHRIRMSYRRIAPADLPTVTDLDGTVRAATPDELLNLGLLQVDGDLYASLQQYQSTGAFDETGEHVFACVGDEHPGEVLSEGLLRARHANLPADVRARVLRADVIEGMEGAPTVHEQVAASFAAVRAEIASSVGPVADHPALAAATDVSRPEALVAEAQRLADHPDAPARRVRIPMAEIADHHVVAQSGLVPHRWAGEPDR